MQRCHQENMEGQEEAMVYDPDYLGLDLQPEPSGLFDASLFAKYLARETMGSLGGAQPTGSTWLVKLEPGMASTSDDSGVCSDPTNSPENGSGVSEPLQLPPVVQLARYGGIPFCLARKNSGIQLNCQKKGKKPNRWFMDVSLMTAEDAERHREYLRKKENGLLPQKRRRKKTGKRITKGRSRTNTWQPKPSTSGLKGGKVKAKQPRKHRRVTWDNEEEDSDEEEAYRLAQELMVKLEKQSVSDSGKAKPQRVSGRSKKNASSLKMLPSSASTLPRKTVGVKTSSSSAGIATATASLAVDHSEAGTPAKPQASTSDFSGSKAASLRRRSKLVVKKKPSQTKKKALKKPAAGKNTGVQTLAWKKKSSGVSSLLYVNVKEEPREVRNAPASALSPFAISHYNTTVAATNTQCWLNALLAGAARGCHGNTPPVDGGTKAASAVLVGGTHFDDLKEEFFVKGLQLQERRRRDGVKENGVVLSTTSSSSTIPPQGETPSLDDPNVPVASEGKDSNVKTDLGVSAVHLQGFGKVLTPAAEGASDSDIWQATTECLLGVLEAVSAEQLQGHSHPAVLATPCEDLELNDGDTAEENVSLLSHGVVGDSKANGPLLPQPTVVEEDMEVEDRYPSAEELVPKRSMASSQSLDPTESLQETRRFCFAADMEVDEDRVTPQEVQQPQPWSVSKEGGSAAQSHSVKNPSSRKLQKSSFDPFLSVEEDSEGISMSETLCEAEKNVCEEQSLESSFALPEIVENITEVNYSERELQSDVDAANTSSAALQESEDMLQSEEISPSESVSAEMQLETNMTEPGTTPSEVSALHLSQTEDSCHRQHITAELLPKETVTNCSSDHVQESSTSLSQTVGNRQGGSSSADSLSRKKTRSSGMKGDGLGETAESVQEKRLPTEAPPADNMPSTCSVGVKDAAAQNGLDGALPTKSHPTQAATVATPKTGTSELQQLIESSQEEAVKEGQCSQNNSEEHFEAPLTSLQSDLENKTKPVPGMNEPATVCDSLSEHVQTRSSGMLEKCGNQERVCDLSKCLHVLVADIRTNPLARNSLQRFGVSKAYLDVSPTAAQRNTEEPPKRTSGKKNKQATAKPKVSPRKASRAAKSSPKKKSTASRVTGKGADAASSSSVDAENANATGIGGLLLATATVAKQGGSPAKASPKIKEQTGKGKALASEASAQKNNKRKPGKVGRPRKRAGNKIAKDVGHEKVLDHVEEHCHVEGQHLVEGSSPVEGHSHADSHIDEHSHDEGQGHVDEHSHIDGHSHVEGQGHVDEQSHTDGHSHVEGHSHVDEHIHIARHNHVEEHSHVDGHSHIDRHSHVEMHSHVDGHCPVEGYNHVERHSPMEGMTDESVEGASGFPIAIKLEFDEPATDERFLMVGVVDYESTVMTVDNCTTNSQESTGADSLTASSSKTLTSQNLTANNRTSVSNKTLPTQDPEIDKQPADKGVSTTKPPRTKTAKKSRRSALKETVAATSPKQPKRSHKLAHISGMDTDIEAAQACPKTTDNGGDLPAEPSTVGCSDKGKPVLATSPPRTAPSAAVASPRKSERARKVRQPVTHPHSTEVIENIKTLLHNKPGAKLPAGLKRLGILTSYQHASAKKEVAQPSAAKRLPGNGAALRSSTKMVEDPPMQHDKAAAAASVSEEKAASATGEEARDRVGMEPMSLDSTEDASLQPSLTESETKGDHLRLPERLDPSADDGGKDQPQKAVAASGELCHIPPEMPRAEGDSDTSSKTEGGACKEPVSSPADRELALTEEGASGKRDSPVTDSEFRLAERDVNGKPDSPVTDSEFRLAEGDVNEKPDSPVTDREFRLAERDVNGKPDSPVTDGEFRLAEGDVNGKPDTPVTDSEFRLAEGNVKEKPDSPVIANEFRLAEGDVNRKPVSPVTDREFRLTEVSVNEEPVSASDSKLGLTEVGVNEKQVPVLDSGPGLAESASEEPVFSTVDRGLGLVEGVNKEPVSSAVDCGLGLVEGGVNKEPVSSSVDHGLGLAEEGANEVSVSSAVDHGLGLAEGGANEGPVSSTVDRGLGLAEGGVTVSEDPVSVLDCGLGLAESDGNKEPVFSAINSGLGLAGRSATEEPTSSVINSGLGLAAGGASGELVPVLDHDLGLAERVNEEPVSSVIDPGLGVAEEGANKEPVSSVLGLGPTDGGVNEEPVSSVLDHGVGLTRGGVNAEPVSVLDQGLGLAEGGAVDKPVPSVLDQGLGLAEGGVSKEAISVLGQGLGLVGGGVNEEPVAPVLDPELGLAEGGVNEEPVSSVLDCGAELAERGIDQDASSSAVDHSRDASPEKSTGNLVTVAQRKVFSVEIQAAIRKANTGQAESSAASDGCAVSPLPSGWHARFSGRTLRNKSSVSGSSHHQQNPVPSDGTPADFAIVAPPADVTSESSPRNKARKVFRKQKGKSKALKRLNAKRKFGARGNVNEKRARSGTAGKGENKAHHQLWAKIKQAQAKSTKRTAKSAMKQTVQTATAAAIATKTAIKKSKNSAFKIVKPCGKTSSRALKEPGMGVSRKRKRFMYVETDMGESPDPPCKKRGRPPGPKIILDRSQANLCFEPAQLLPWPGPVDADLVDDASSFGAEVPSWLLTQAGTLAPSFAEGGLCIVPSQSNPVIYTVLPPPSAQSPPPGDAAAMPESSEACQLQISIAAPEEYAASQLNDLEMPDIKPVLSQLNESALPDVKPLIDELKHMNSSSPPQLLNETQVSGAAGLMWNEQPLPLPAESSKSQEDLGQRDKGGAARDEASTSGPAELECSAHGKSQHVQSTLTSQHQRLRHVVGRRHKIRRRKKKDRLFSAQVRYKEAVGVSYDGDRRRSRRPKKSRLTDEEMRMAQDSPTSDLEREERALTSERGHPLGGIDEDAGSDIEFVSADYSHVDFSAQRLFLENLRVETFPFGELGDGQEAMEMLSQGEFSELDTAGEQGDLDLAGEASNGGEFVTDEVGFGEMMSCPEFDDSPEEGGILGMESGPQVDVELAVSNEKLELVEAAGFGIEAHVPRVPCVKAEDSLVGQVYPNLDGIEEISEPLTDIEAMQSDVMKHPPWAHAEECTLKTEETEEYPAGSRCNCMDSESDCEGLAARGAHTIIKEEVKAELGSEIATQCISPELPHPQLQAFTPGLKHDDGHEVSVMENVEAGCAQNLKHEADVSDISMGMLVPDTPPSSRMHVPIEPGTALEGSPSLTIFVKTSEGRGVLIQDDPKNVIKDEFAQNN